MKKLILTAITGCLLVGLTACDGFKSRDTQKEAKSLKKQTAPANSITMDNPEASKKASY